MPEYLTIEIPIYPSMTYPELVRFCAEYDCTVAKGEGDYYYFTTRDPANFFWLGSNLTLRSMTRHDS